MLPLRWCYALISWIFCVSKDGCENSSVCWLWMVSKCYFHWFWASSIDYNSDNFLHKSAQIITLLKTPRYATNFYEIVPICSFCQWIGSDAEYRLITVQNQKNIESIISFVGSCSFICLDCAADPNRFVYLVTITMWNNDLQIRITIEQYKYICWYSGIPTCKSYPIEKINIFTLSVKFRDKITDTNTSLT